MRITSTKHAQKLQGVLFTGVIFITILIVSSPVFPQQSQKENIVEEEVIKNVHLSEDLAKGIGEKAKNYILIHKTNNNK